MATKYRFSIFVAVLSAVTLGVCGSLWAQNFYDDDGAPQYEAPAADEEDEDDDSDWADEDRDGIPTFEESHPRTRDQARSREQRHRDHQYDTPISGERPAGFVPYSDPYSLRVMNYQFWIGASSILVSQVALATVFVGVISYPLMILRSFSQEAQVTLAVIGGGLYLLPSIVIMPMVINFTGNRYYPDQYLGAFLGGLGGLGVAVAAKLGFIYADMHMGPGTNSMYRWVLLLTGVLSLGAPAAGGVLGYHIQANHRANQRSNQRRKVELLPAPFVSSDNGQTNFGLGLHGRF